MALGLAGATRRVRADPPAPPPERTRGGKAPLHERGRASPLKTTPSKRGWYVVPNIAFDTDDGFGMGVRGELALKEPGYRPYRTAYVAHFFFTLRGYHHHRLRFDRTGIGKNKTFRLTAHLAWRQWLNDGYWGIGNDTTRERRYVGSFEDDAPERKRYRYTLLQPFGHLTLRARLWRRWSTFASLNAKYSIVDTYEQSLLAAQRPFGIDGGLGLVVSTGIIYDSREPEVNPTSGVYFELGGRLSGPPRPFGAGTFGGVFAVLRSYLSLSSWLVIASRAMGEILFGQIPFFEMVHWGGATPVAGFGGFATLRGISFGRWRAPGKAIFNLEARFKVLGHKVRGKQLEWQVALFGDAGIVFAAGDRTTQQGPEPDFPLHPAAGVGFRLIYENVFVGRIDAGLGLDPIVEPAGSTTNDTTFGFYVVFDHAF